MKTRLLIIMGLVVVFLIPMNFAQGLPVFLDCIHDSDFIISPNKLEFVPDETFVLNVKTKQNDTSFEITVMNPRGQEVFADVVDIDKDDYAQTKFHIPDNAEKGTWSIFVTATPSDQQEIIFIGVNETPQSQFSIKSLFVNYKYKVDDASFLVAGNPNTDVQVNILDHNTEKIGIYIITLPPEGKCSFTLDLDGYRPGVYDVEISDYDHDVTTVFTVGMQPSTGVIAISLFSNSYFFGDDVFVSIETSPEIDLSVEVTDPSGNIVNKFSATSEKNGTLHTSVDLPEYGEDGIWAITVRSGANFDTIEFNVSQSIQDNAPYPRTHGGSISSDRTVYPVPWDSSPLKQFKSGIPIDKIQCKEDLVLIQKYDGSPACIKENTQQKLAKRGWSEHKELLLVIDNDQKDIGRYLKDVSILDEHYVDVMMSYPTNTAHHEIYPDEYQSIVSDCIEKNNDANLSLLYLKEIDTKQNQVTFRQEHKIFDGLQCDEALWQELTRWGYCGPPGPFLPYLGTIIPSIAEAHRQASFVFDVPKYLPEGYDIQKIIANRGDERMTFFISPEPITDETNMCEFSWADEGIFLSYVKLAEDPSLGYRYSDSPDEPQMWPVTINDNPGRAEQRWVGDRFGTPIPQLSNLYLHVPDDGILVTMRSSLQVDDLIKVAESISNPIFNSDMIPDYSHVDALLTQNDDNDKNSIPVKVTGKTAKQICNKVKMICDDNHYFNATYDVQTNTATFEQSVSYNNYALEINNRQICHKLNKDPTNYCSSLNMDYSSILDGNKDTMLSQPLDYWKNLPRDEQMAFYEEYGDLFFDELGKMVLKDELKKELVQQNIVNVRKDFRLHTGLVEESLPPFVYYTTVVNSTDGKSYVLGGRTHTNQVLHVYHDELIFYDDVSAKLPIDSFRNDSPVIVIRPENESDRHSHKLFINFDENQDVTFVNSLSVPIRIQDPGNGNPEKEHELAWIGPTMQPSETWIIQINATGYYEWSAKIAPTEHGGWWEPYESGDIIVYSQDMSNVEFRDKLRIAGEFVMDSEIPVNNVGMGNNQGLRIGFSQAIIEMLSDAKSYYMARAEQVIPFDVPIIFRN